MVSWRSRRDRFARAAASTAAAALLVVVVACGGSASTTTNTKTNLNSELPSKIRQAGVLTMLTAPVFKPISYYKEGSTTDIIGSDVDIMRAMGDELGVKVNLLPVQFPEFIPGIQSGRGDVAGGGLTDTEQREQQVSFVDDFILGELYVVRKGNPAGISSDYYSACGKKISFTVGAQSVNTVNTLVQKCKAKGLPAPDTIQTSDVNATVLAVRSGRADVSYYDDLGFDAVNAAANNELQAFKIQGYPAQYWGFAVSKDDTQLQKALLDALKAIIANRKYAKILDQYGVSSDALNDPGINLQTVRPQGGSL